MNTVILMGRLTKDPEIRYSQGENQTAIAGFSVAVDRRFKREGGPEADFFDCSAFGRSAEFVEKYLKKGTKIVLQGRIENNNYTNREGQKVYGVRIVAENIEFAESKAASERNAANSGSSSSSAPASSSKGSKKASAPAPAPAPAPSIDDGFMNIPDGIDEELPFM